MEYQKITVDDVRKAARAQRVALTGQLWPSYESFESIVGANLYLYEDDAIGRLQLFRDDSFGKNDELRFRGTGVQAYFAPRKGQKADEIAQRIVDEINHTIDEFNLADRLERKYAQLDAE